MKAYERGLPVGHSRAITTMRLSLNWYRCILGTPVEVSTDRIWFGLGRPDSPRGPVWESGLGIRSGNPVWESGLGIRSGGQVLRGRLAPPRVAPTPYTVFPESVQPEFVRSGVAGNRFEPGTELEQGASPSHARSHGISRNIGTSRRERRHRRGAESLQDLSRFLGTQQESSPQAARSRDSAG